MAYLSGKFIPTDQVEITELKDKIFFSVTVNDDKDCITFQAITGETYFLRHQQDCCEAVEIKDIVGDLSDLVDYPMTLAEESRGDSPAGYDYGEYPSESHTWTFYKFATAKGYVDISWLGESNGYYSEEVSLEKVRT